MALPAGGLDIARRQDGFFRVLVSFSDRRGGALPAMTDDASKLVEGMRDLRMRAEGLGHIR